MSSTKKEAFSAHIRALRQMLLISAGAIVALFLVFFYTCVGDLVDFILEPVRQRGVEVISTSVSGALMMQLKVCLIAAVIAAMPIIIWQIWRFVSPALYPKEKVVFAGLFFVALLLFMTGVVFCYALVFPLAIDLFWTAAEGVATNLWSVQEYLDFVLTFVLPFGFMFELPVAVCMLARHGIVNYEKMAKARKYVILVIVIVAAVLTPPDVVSQCLLGLPMMLLYEIAVQLTRFIKPADKAAAQ